jgi:hypothetical protein
MQSTTGNRCTLKKENVVEERRDDAQARRAGKAEKTKKRSYAGARNEDTGEPGHGREGGRRGAQPVGGGGTRGGDEGTPQDLRGGGRAGRDTRSGRDGRPRGGGGKGPTRGGRAWGPRGGKWERPIAGSGGHRGRGHHGRTRRRREPPRARTRPGRESGGGPGLQGRQPQGQTGGTPNTARRCHKAQQPYAEPRPTGPKHRQAGVTPQPRGQEARVGRREGRAKAPGPRARIPK